MRDLLIVSIVGVMALMALKRPWIGVMLWTWISIMNPHRYTYGFAYSAPLAAVAAGATLLGLLFTRERQSPFQGPPMVWFFVLSLAITFSWLFGMDPVGDFPQWDKVMKIYLMTFVAAMLLYTKHHIIAFAWVTVGSLALLGLKGGIFTILTGGNHRTWGPIGSFIQDNNEFALAIIMAIPMLHFLQLQLKSGWMRHAASITMLLCAASALGSHSRGALLAISAMGLLFWWRSQRKGPIALMIGVVVLALLPMMPEHWWDRMHTIRTYEEDASAMGRINAWIVAWEVAKNHWFGAGMSYQHEILFMLYGVYDQKTLAAHSIYFQILGNHGFLGLFLYLAMWVSAYRAAGWLNKHARNNPETRWAADLGAMAQVCFVGFAVGGAFLSLSYFDLPYNVMVMVVLAKRWVVTRAWEREAPVSFLEYAGLGRFQRRNSAREITARAQGQR
ncbi:putative O-glycosylation ligase, exosortase A system-associated [Thauera sp. 63]|jgi:probable O-glycosylation ligase (exosortase A-associated)|uniref:putative O-glycosylation ligase, exosortase A system-associated n=1 Tax=Thauera sp. 63 TaxID=497321 RepID=UPI0002D0EFB6|nr:putative O-glycosylation ligase, exosortase A system-associated [Thauera sp. 63]ENO78175.1 hypothetical protein C664_09495 [Thauera sp. 63]